MLPKRRNINRISKSKSYLILYSALYRRIKQATKKMVRPQYNLDVMQSDYSGGNITSVSYSSGGGGTWIALGTWNIGVSVTRLGDFLISLEQILLKVAEMFGDFWGSCESLNFLSWTGEATFWATFGKTWVTFYFNIWSHWSVCWAMPLQTS